MADYKNIVPFIRKAEGGLSKATTDMAHLHPVPDGTGYHTNKGITWQTWSGVFGTDVNSIKRFYAMSDADWLTIYKKYYWDAIKGDDIESQRIADTLVNWVWGSGQYSPVSNLQKILGIHADGSFGRGTLDAVNNADETKLYNDLKKVSYDWFTRLGNNPQYSANKQGWLNRLSSLANFVESSVSSSVKKTIEVAKKHYIVVPLIAIGIIGLAYVGYKYLGSKK
jgi:lysozyme family protein